MHARESANYLDSSLICECDSQADEIMDEWIYV